MDLASQAVELFYSDRFCVYRNIIALIGIAWVAKCTVKTLLSLCRVFRTYYLAPWGISRMNLRRHGEWAIITGASEGIGKGYALELAHQGFNVVIMSRSAEKLRNVETEIRSKYNCNVRVIPVDFSMGQSVYEDIQAEISDLDVGILVNNVGLSVTMPDYFTEIQEDRHRNIIELNCQTMVQMTHLVLPKMAENGRGIIVNIASLGGIRPTPMLAVYGATKSFVISFSAALRCEYQKRGIIVQAVCPGFVATAMSGIRRSNWMAPDPVKYSRQAVATIGVQDVTGGWMAHDLQWYIINLVPESLFLKFVLSQLKAEKKKVLKRKNKSQ